MIGNKDTPNSPTPDNVSNNALDATSKSEINPVQVRKRTFGEKGAWTMEFDPGTLRAMAKRLQRIDQQLQRLGPDYVSGNITMTLEEEMDWLQPRPDHWVYPIVGSSVLKNAEEIGQLQGWIAFYTSDEERRRVERGINQPLDDKTLVYEISFAKLQESESGQVSSVLRQTLIRLLLDHPEKIHVITEQTPAGENTIAIQIDIIVAAYHDPKNADSGKVLEHAGLVLQPHQVMWDEANLQNPEHSKDLFYVLDWNKLLSLIYKKANKEIFGEETEYQSNILPVEKQFPDQVLAPPDPHPNPNFNQAVKGMM